MYGIFANIYLLSDRNVGTYSIYWTCHEKFETFFRGKNNAPGSSLASDQPCCSAGLEEDPEDQAEDHQIKGQKTCQGPQLKMD